MTPTQLRAFACVVRHGSVKAAAEELGITESAVSMNLRQLRSEFDDPLFTRTPSGLAFTPGGLRLASRAREIGTLRAIGFRRGSILSSFLLESIVLCLGGGVLGCLATLPFNGLSTGTANWATFSEITFSFRFGWAVLAQGILMAVIMGAVGGLFPAVRAVRMKIVNALREQ